MGTDCRRQRPDHCLIGWLSPLGRVPLALTSLLGIALPTFDFGERLDSDPEKLAQELSSQQVPP
jgi:hypothetical protein